MPRHAAKAGATGQGFLATRELPGKRPGRRLKANGSSPTSIPCSRPRRRMRPACNWPGARSTARAPPRPSKVRSTSPWSTRGGRATRRCATRHARCSTPACPLRFSRHRPRLPRNATTPPACSASPPKPTWPFMRRSPTMVHLTRRSRRRRNHRNAGRHPAAGAGRMGPRLWGRAVERAPGPVALRQYKGASKPRARAQD